jgi:hypothetical protein
MLSTINCDSTGKVASAFFRPWLGRKKEIYRQDDLYRRLRDDLQGADLKEKIELLWREFESFAPKPFLRNAQIDFHQRWWEMYLTVGLLHLSNVSGFKVETSKKDKGPDVKITYADGKCIWIEAVAPEPGDKENNSSKENDSVPELELNKVEDFPEKQLLLRLTQALMSKNAKINKYLGNKIINQRDPCIIALSSCGLNQFGSLLGSLCPAPLKVLAGCGNIVLSKNKPRYFSKRQPIEKIKSKKTVPVCLFEDPTFDSISAVLYSSPDPINAPPNPESTFQIILNSCAKVPLPDFFFNNIETWY